MSPLYEYRCACGKHHEAYHSVDFRDAETCPQCGLKPERVLSLNATPVVHEYWSENLQAQITGPRQRREIMKKNNMSEIG